MKKFCLKISIFIFICISSLSISYATSYDQADLVREDISANKESRDVALKELYAAALICSFYSCFTFFGAGMVDFSLKQHQISYDDRFKNNKKNIVREIRDTDSKIKFLEEEENTITL